MNEAKGGEDSREGGILASTYSNDPLALFFQSTALQLELHQRRTLRDLGQADPWEGDDGLVR